MTFDGQSSYEYGLMVYDFDTNEQEDVDLTSPGSMITDHVPGRNDTYFYGADLDEPLKFTLILCVNEESANSGKFLDRFDIADIASWLTGHNEYKWLTINQPDLDAVRYKCYISRLKPLSHGNVPWAISCEVTCDSPFGYYYPESFQFSSSVGGCEVLLGNRSVTNRLYYPIMNFELSGTTIEVINHSDNNRTFKMSDIPESVKSIAVDNDTQIITDTVTGLNLYPYWNKQFLRLCRGSNKLRLVGDFKEAEEYRVCE